MKINLQTAGGTEAAEVGGSRKVGSQDTAGGCGEPLRHIKSTAL